MRSLQGGAVSPKIPSNSLELLAKSFQKNLQEPLSGNSDIKKIQNNCHIITVSSGKGGVGKSHITANLAIQLSLIGKRVLILDADIGMANQDVLMGIDAEYNINDVLRNDVSLEEAVINGPCGVYLLCGGSGNFDFTDISSESMSSFQDEFYEYTSHFDFVFIDTAAGLSASVLSMINSGKELFVITTPEPTSLADAYSLLRVVTKKNKKLKCSLIVNRARSVEDASEVSEKVQLVCEKFLDHSLNYLGFIIEDSNVIEASRERIPFSLLFPDSVSSRCIRVISSRLCGLEVKFEETNESSSFFRRLWTNIYRKVAF